jgi:dihydroxy-acid dehydratase
MTIAQESGRQAVKMVLEDLRPSKIMTREAFENAIITTMALGGSTNAVIHLIAIAGRLGIDLPLELFDQISKKTPMVTNVKPSGEFLMEDFFYAGGVPAIMKEISSLLDMECLTINGLTLGENLSEVETINRDIIRSLQDPIHEEGGIVVLRGNLAPKGAVIKQTAATPGLLTHRGQAVVFKNREDLIRRIDDPDLDVTADSVLVLQNAGPKGAPGMPEWGQLPIPKKLLQQGVTDMVRISDARMSGTSYGTTVLHISPESACGGPLAIVQTGDWIELDVPGRELRLVIDDRKLANRLQTWKPPDPHYRRGYGRLFLEHVLQADQGCDFDFLTGKRDLEDDLAPGYARMGHS